MSFISWQTEQLFKISVTTILQQISSIIYLFHATDFFLYALKTSENLVFSGGIEREQKHETGSAEDWLSAAKVIRVEILM